MTRYTYQMVNKHFNMRIAPVTVLLFLFGLMLLNGCGREADDPSIKSLFQGQLAVDPAVDSVADYRDFEIVVGQSGPDGLDTLGYAITDSTGHFVMEISAPQKGIYPLLISRRGTMLRMDEIAIAEGDTATLKATFPLGNRYLRINSKENAAVVAYKNTMALHNQALREMVGASESYDINEVGRLIGQSATILWSMRESFPNTLGGDLATAQSIELLGGWNDSLVVERAQMIEPSNPRYVEVVRTARQAQSRLQGPEAGITLLRSYMEPVTDPDLKAALHVELVAAYMDNGLTEEATQAADEIVASYPDTPWAEWARRAAYDFEHLMPGMLAPSLTIETWDGSTITLDSLRGHLVLLEFYRPEDPSYQNELGVRNALFQVAGNQPFEIVSISMQPDPEINEAFLDGRSFPGIRAVAPVAPEQGDDVVAMYNVQTLPRRFLIDQSGEIYGRYDGYAINAIIEDVARLALEEDQPS